MAGSMPPSDPVAISNPLPAPSTSILSGPSEQLPFLKQSPSKPESHLTSIASAGLRTSPSPSFGSPVPTSAPGMSSSITAGSTDQPTELRKEEQSQHHDSPRVAREALGVTVESSKENDVRLQDSSNTVNEHAEPSTHPTQVSTDDMQVDSHPSPGILTEQSVASGDQAIGQASLMNTSTVASPGPIEETTSQDGDRPRHQMDHVAISEDANKAFSYPMPAASPLEQRRGLSLPHSGFHKGSPRSPSAKKHRCPYCSTEFTRHHNLKSHLLTHSQEKPYVCQTCQSRFRRLHDLKRHTKLHTGERPHICDKCGRRFARGDALARHNKGQGGCAGRRSSMGSYVGEEDFGDPGAGADDTMDGLMYTEPERMDEEEERRLGLPGMRKHNVSTEPIPRAPSVFQPRGPNTYPPIATTTQPPPSSRNLFPPPNNHGGGSSSSTSPISQSGNISFPVTTHSSTSTSFPAPNMTESPKALSPNTLSAPQVSHAADSSGIHTHQQHRPHSPGLNQQYQQPHFRHGLPHPQLPPPPGLGAPPDSRFLHSQGSVQNGPPSSLTAKHGGTHSHSSSLGAALSSQANVESGPSGMPESNAQSDQSREDKLWAYIRSVHDELSALRTEVAALRSQIQNQGTSSATQAQSGGGVR